MGVAFMFGVATSNRQATKSVLGFTLTDQFIPENRSRPHRFFGESAAALRIARKLMLQKCEGPPQLRALRAAQPFTDAEVERICPRRSAGGAEPSADGGRADAVFVGPLAQLGAGLQIQLRPDLRAVPFNGA